MSLFGKVCKYENSSFFLEDNVRIKLTPNQAEGYKPIGLTIGKEPADLVGSYVKFYIKKNKYTFTTFTPSNPEGIIKKGFVYGLIRLECA